ncbi:pentapeptide repeat-containing protein [Pleionea litopenaei]|uniref:Pentapeptide repeat-containing protein n=1 Tax=Pleionea litopenaei TaxID=3070815 RepID=A0AA51RUY7_9GAMM|nr:pentapeptide repeat-containing protein [Pleionea sp. HL-JVS1]WMS87959.1 pentapeptide repeat-containing protein [Pleionea sp. HL-JVS1]
MTVKIIDDPLYQLLRNEQVAAFNKQRASVDKLDFSNCDFRGLDLRGLNATGINFSGAYFRGADLRGVDFSQSNLRGASIASAHVSGCYFPVELNPNEIELSIARGTRMRYQ